MPGKGQAGPEGTRGSGKGPGGTRSRDPGCRERARRDLEKGPGMPEEGQAGPGVGTRDAGKGSSGTRKRDPGCRTRDCYWELPGNPKLPSGYLPDSVGSSISSLSFALVAMV